MWRPRKVSQGTTDPVPKNLTAQVHRGRVRERPKTEKRPLVVTVEEGGRERTWGPLSRIAVWRAGCFWQDMQGAAKVFIKKKTGRWMRSKLSLESNTEERFWFNQKKDQPQHGEEEPAPREEKEVALEEDTPEEIEARNKMWLIEKVTTLERENGEMKKSLRETTTRIFSMEKHNEGCCRAMRSH